MPWIDLAITLSVIFGGLTALVLFAWAAHWFFQHLVGGIGRGLGVKPIAVVAGADKREAKRSQQNVQEVVNRLQQEGRLDDLEAELRTFKYAELDELNREAWSFNWGVAAFRRGDRDEAFRRFSEASAKFPNSQSIAFLLAQEYEARAEPRKMVELFRKCTFPQLSAEDFLLASRYCYLWNLFDDASRLLDTILNSYFQLRIADDHYVDVRGLPFFGRTWKHLLCVCAAKKEFSSIENLTLRARRDLSDYDFDTLECLLDCVRRGDFAADIKRLEDKKLAGSATNGISSYDITRLAALRCLTEVGQAQSASILDLGPRSSGDLAWLNDVVTLHRARIASLEGLRQQEEDLLGQFFAQQPLMLEPSMAVDFGLCEYQETLKTHYQMTRPVGPPWTSEADGELASPVYGLRIHVELREVESRQRKFYVFSRPVAGIQGVEMLGHGYVSPGHAQLSPNGRFLLIVDNSNVWLFDLAKQRYMHETLRDPGWYFYQHPCRGRTAAYGYSDHADKASHTVSIEICEDGELKKPHEWNKEVP